MRKSFLIPVFIFLGFLTQPVYSTSLQVSVFNHAAFEVNNELLVQPDAYFKELLLPILEELGLEIQELDFQNVEEKSCTVRIRGTYQSSDGERKEIDVTITIYGKTCTELLRDLMKK